MSIGRHRLIAPIYLVILGIGVWWCTKPNRELKLLTQTLNIVAFAAVVLPVLQISVGYFQELRAEVTDSSNAPQDLRIAGDKPAPDVYYIILDAYSRDDILDEVYDYDNSSFLNELTNLGFYVARCSQSNYAQTQLSLASALNLDYISELGGGFRQNRPTGWVCLV